MPRTGTLANWVLVLTAAGGLGAIVLARVSELQSRRPGLPVLDRMPRPMAQEFNGCPADGDGGDHLLNYLKNRTDESTWLMATGAAVRALGSPGSAGRSARSTWSGTSSRAVHRFEGLPLALEGYLLDVREEGAESTNCHADDAASRDWHVWLADSPGSARSSSIIAELTPRVRTLHPEWLIDDLRQVMRDSVRVRISGWLLFDQEHPEQVGKSRATLWEIHPVMRVEFWRGDQWVEW